MSSSVRLGGGGGGDIADGHGGDVSGGRKVAAPSLEVLKERFLGASRRRSSTGLDEEGEGKGEEAKGGDAKAAPWTPMTHGRCDVVECFIVDKVIPENILPCRPHTIYQGVRKIKSTIVHVATPQQIRGVLVLLGALRCLLRVMLR